MARPSVSATDSNQETLYVSALAQQNLELRKARTKQRQLKCGAGSIIQISPNGKGDCAELGSSIERMKLNLQILTDKLQAIRRLQTREQLIDRLVQEGCSLDGIVTDEASHREAYLDVIAKGRVPMTSETGHPSSLMPSGPVRTVCVRTCDGGFFPINSQSSAADFERDAALCSNMCPGVETELYFHSIFQPETSDMISTASGRRYTELPAAFAYRSRRSDEGCRCDFKGFSENRRDVRSASTTTSQEGKSIVEIPSRPDGGRQDAISASQPPIERELDEEALNVRKVGPTFLPPDHGTINLRRPSSDGPQPLQVP
ncbi:DUF2865 domain-containing protein [Peteryoungia ipomoeae]|uniref:DUF2865 domain-containing protein n=1 Tax=Peteryoungia ipomoeae TaxID=1210932 RepID=UPI00197EC946|nr:DUF2865 domain-containing protein [Peteryoungia ipomoeae]